MDTNEFASFRPIISLNADNKEKIKSYYLKNNLNPDNEYMERYLDINKPTKTPILPTITPPKNKVDIGKILAEVSSGITAQGPYQPEVTANLKMSGSVNDKAKYALNTFMRKGYTKAQASGIVGNLFEESGFSHTISGDSGLAYGAAQWHPDRQANFRKVFKKDIKQSSYAEQLEFIDWELRNTQNVALKALLNSKTPKEASKAFFKFERFKGYDKPEGGKSGLKRQQHAETFYNLI